MEECQWIYSLDWHEEYNLIFWAELDHDGNPYVKRKNNKFVRFIFIL